MEKKKLPRMQYKKLSAAKSRSEAKGLQPKAVRSEDIEQLLPPEAAEALKLPHADPKVVAGTSLDITENGGPALKIGRLRISKRSIEALKARAEMFGQPWRITLMSPDDFLKAAPSTVSAEIPAFLQKPQHYDGKSLAHARNAIEKGEAINIGMLDYSRRKSGWPSHDMRHRAYAMKQLGIRSMPVFIIGQKDIAGSAVHAFDNVSTLQQ